LSTAPQAREVLRTSGAALRPGLVITLLLCLVALTGLGTVSPAQVVFGPTLNVSGYFTFGGHADPYMLTWLASMHCTGARWGANEDINIHVYGPLNTLGASPSDRYIGTLTSDGSGNLEGDVTLPYDDGVTGYLSQPNILRPGRYRVHAVGTLHPEAVTDNANATHEINLYPWTVNDGTTNWGRSRGGRDGLVGTPSPEREDPEWPSVWSVQPVELYATVGDTGTDGANQTSIISYQDYPGTHYAHDANMIIEPDEEYRWLLGGANFLGTPPDRDAGRMELEWETLNGGNNSTYGQGVIGLPIWTMAVPGDRLYVVGRWSLDNGHPDNGDSTEIHNPRLVATIRKRNTAVLLPGTDCPTRASQVDVYVSGHGGGSNAYPDDLEDILNNNDNIYNTGAGGGRIEDVLDSSDLDLYERAGPVPPEIFAQAALLISGLGGDPTDLNFSAGPSAFDWNRGPEERPVNDMDYDFDVPLPAPPGGATHPLVEVDVQPQDTGAVTEVITYTNPGPNGLPTTAHIHLPFYGVPDQQDGSGQIYGRTLKFFWDVYSPPGRHFTVNIDDINVKDTSDFLSDGEFFLWTNVCGQWVFLSGLNPDLFDVGTQTYPTTGANFDVYLDPGDPLYVFTEGYEQDSIDDFFGAIYSNPYSVAVLAGVNAILFGSGDNDDLAGAVFVAPPIPIDAVTGSHRVASAEPAADNQVSYFDMDFTVKYVPTPRIDVNGLPANFGNVPLGSSADRVIQIFNLNDDPEDPLDVSAITVSGAGYMRLANPNVPFTVAGGEEVDITVRFSPTALDQGAGTITINSTDPCNKSLTFDLSANVTSPVISVLPADTTFPPTVVGSSRTQAVTVTNTGSADLIVNSATIAGTGFSVSGPAMPLHLAPNSSTVFTVTFAPPSVARRFDGTLTVTSTDPNNPSVAVTFCGEGVSTGVRLLVLQADGTPYATVDRISLSSYGVKPSTSLRLKDMPLTSILPPTSCEPIAYHLEMALPSTAAAGGRGSYYNIRVQVGKTIQSVSFTLDTYEFKRLVVTLQ
jgi:hypothetical protein